MTHRRDPQLEADALEVSWPMAGSWVERKRKWMHLGVRGLLHIAQSDNKQRFQFRGRYQDPRCDYIGLAYYPLWVLQLADSSIATEWISHYPSNKLAGKYATFDGRPVVGIDKAPPRLYHRTLKDAAFSILQEGMIAGYGDSGKLHSYFAEETLEELGTRAGVRADHPVEIVMDTALVASECWLFKPRSEGVSTRPRSCISETRAPTRCCTPPAQTPQKMRLPKTRSMTRRWIAPLTRRPLKFPDVNPHRQQQHLQSDRARDHGQARPGPSKSPTCTSAAKSRYALNASNESS